MNNTDDSLADYVNTKILYQAGVDFESRPIVVCCAGNLPDPLAFDYDKLLDLILLKLDLFVENDYTVILFSGGAKYRPSWSWLFRAYRSLSRKYKKNLKALWIVHPTLWARIFLNVMNAVLSPKFSRKIVYCRSLSQLAVHVPLIQIDIPKEAYEYNAQFESEIKYPSLSDQAAPSMFGIPLSTVMGIDGEKGLPKVVTNCIEYLREKGLKTEGLFRRSPSSAELKEAKKRYDEGHEVDLEQYGVHVAAVLLKMYFRELPQPIFSQDNYPSLLQFQSKVVAGDEATAIRDLREVVLSALPMPEQIILKEVMIFLKDVVAESSVNLMTSFNIAVVWAPNLARSGNPILDVSVTSTAVVSAIRLCVDHHTEVFEGVHQEGWHPQPSPAIPIRAMASSLSSTQNSSLSPSLPSFGSANILTSSAPKNVALVEKSPAVAVGLQAPADTDLLDDLRKAIPENIGVP